MQSAPEMETVKKDADLRSVLLKARPVNPALQRLQSRMMSDAQASEVITSYDRMHHRHSRS